MTIQNSAQNTAVVAQINQLGNSSDFELGKICKTLNVTGRKEVIALVDANILKISVTTFYAAIKVYEFCSELEILVSAGTMALWTKAKKIQGFEAHFAKLAEESPSMSIVSPRHMKVIISEYSESVIPPAEPAETAETAETEETEETEETAESEETDDLQEVFNAIRTAKSDNDKDAYMAGILALQELMPA